MHQSVQAGNTVHPCRERFLCYSCIPEISYQRLHGLERPMPVRQMLNACTTVYDENTSLVGWCKSAELTGTYLATSPKST